MTDTTLIISATLILCIYFVATSRLRLLAEESRLRALSAAKELSVSEATPESVRKFIGNKDVLGSRSIAPWIVAVTIPFIAIAAAFSFRDDRMLDDVEKAGEKTAALFTNYLDASTRSSILRSPIALLIVLLEVAIIALFFKVAQHFTTNLKGGLKSVFTFFYISLDDYDMRGVAGLRL